MAEKIAAENAPLTEEDCWFIGGNNGETAGYPGKKLSAHGSTNKHRIHRNPTFSADACQLPLSCRTGDRPSTTAFLEDAITFTPVRKRKLRPSLSPIQTVSQAKTETQKRMKRNSNSSIRQNVLSQPSPSYDIPTAALNFKDFSFLSEDSKYSINNVSSKEQDVLLSYLAHIYSVTGMYIEPPFLHLVCKELPSENERPFTIAGFIAIWSSHDDKYIRNFFLGNFGEGNNVSLPKHIANDMQEQRIPSDDTILYLAEHVFKDAIAIALVWNSVVACLLEMTDVDFTARLQELPRDLTMTHIAFLQYHNGYLPNSEFRRREIQPPRAVQRGIGGVCRVNPAHTTSCSHDVDLSHNQCGNGCRKLCPHAPKCVWSRESDGVRLTCRDSWPLPTECLCGRAASMYSY